MSALKAPYERISVLPFRIKSASGPNIEGWASTPAVDREGEVVLPEAIAASLEAYMQNPIVTYAHDWLNPIGRTTHARVTDEGLYVRIKLGRTQRAREVAQLIEDRIVRSLSIGFNASPEDGFEKNGVWHWRRIELLEISIVPIPANPQAMFTFARGLGLAGRPPIAVAKETTPFADLPCAPEEAPWVWDTRVQNEILGDPPNWRRYRMAHFWWDPRRPDAKSAYKLPFARIIDGQLMAVWRGVAAAMAALLGARGGVDIPPQDRRPVYEHICRYYEKFGKKPPSFHGSFPDSIADVKFHCGELEIFFELQAERAAAQLAEAAQHLPSARSALEQAASRARMAIGAAPPLDSDSLAQQIIQSLDPPTLAALATLLPRTD